MFLGTPSECQTDLIKIRPDIFVEPDLGPNFLQSFSADKTRRQIVIDLLPLIPATDSRVRNADPMSGSRKFCQRGVQLQH